MDQTTAELIAELCMRAGALMEDRSADLVSAVPSDVAVVERRIARLVQTGEDLAALAAAARILTGAFMPHHPRPRRANRRRGQG